MVALRCMGTLAGRGGAPPFSALSTVAAGVPTGVGEDDVTAAEAVATGARAAMLACPEVAGTGALDGAAEGVGASTSDSNAFPASDFVFTSLSMTAFEGSSSLMNLTPIPAGLSPVACDASRFHTTRPTPAMTA